MENYRQYLDPKVVDKISRLELKARLIVEGFVQGLHRSPYHGVSVEFAEHREYTPGDDLRHLDWKVFGKSDRFYIKRYEEETNLECVIVLDCSESMTYSGRAAGGISKFQYGRLICAALTFLILRQRDSAGLALFDTQLTRYLPPRTNPAHLAAIVKALEADPGPQKTDLGLVLTSLAERIKHRGLVFLISDFFDEPERILAGLSRLKQKKNDVALLHVVDQDETEFPFDRLYRFEGMEGYPDLTVDARALRQAYMEAFQEFETRLRRGCAADRIDYVRMTTDQSLDVALSAYLANRARRMQRR
ncbi:MAG: DUF58 domain-containing protein [Planctomycetota bacterium]